MDGLIHGPGKWMAKAWGAWDRFWFESARPQSLILFRPAFAGLLFFYILTRTPDLMFFYSQSGVLPTEVMEQLMPMGFRLSPLNWIQGDGAVWFCHFALLGSLGSLAFGWFPSVSACLALFFHISFIHRNMASAYGIDSIATFFLLNLALAGKGGNPLRGSLGFRLSQIQVCVIYFYSGVEKLRGSHWLRGDAVWDVMANNQQARWDFSWLAGAPTLVALATWSTLFWEIGFAPLIWIRPLRFPMLAFGVALHLGIGTAMSIPYFGLLMICSYILFLTQDEAQLVRAFLHRGFVKSLKVRRRSPMSTLSE